MSETGEPKNLGETSLGMAANLEAMIACLFPIVGGIVMLVLETKNRFVRFYALQSIFLMGAWAIVSVAFVVGAISLHIIPFIGALLASLLWFVRLLVGLALFIVWIITIVKAFSGVEWEVPYIGLMVRKQLATMGAGEDVSSTPSADVPPSVPVAAAPPVVPVVPPATDESTPGPTSL